MKTAEINGCVIIPTYNNEKTLASVIEGALQYADCVIVVNDGATDSTPQILGQFLGRIEVLENKKNTGKGAALKKGFRHAIASGFDYAITIDSDGQHYPDDIPLFIEAAKERPGALLMGARNMAQEGVPSKSSFGNKFSNFWFWVETGISLPDTQTGFRLYPLAPIKKIRLFTTKFELEIEVIVKLAWRGVPVHSVPVKVLYDKATRVSHFRPFKDFTRISILNTVLFTLTLVYYLPVRLFRFIRKKGLWNILKEEAYNVKESNLKKAASIGFGIFMGIVPIWGFQLLIGIPLAILFRLNKVLFIAAANISIPPMIPPIIFFSYLVGALFVKNKVQITDISHINLQYIHVNFLQYAIGAVALALIAGVAFFLLSLLLFSLGRPKRHEVLNEM